MTPYQYTLRKPVTCRGVGLHSGRPVNLTVKPARTGSGIRFIRSDVKTNHAIPAFMDWVVDTRLATTLGNSEVEVGTIEHLLAALTGMGIDNAVVELDTVEVPIMDGSARHFVRLFRRAGLRRQKGYKKVIKITREIVFHDGERYLRIVPYNGLKITAEIDFPHQVINRQTLTFELTPEGFAREISSARTFGFIEEVEQLWKNGLALGGSLENAVVVDRSGVLNEEGLRFSDEFVRHKVLDLIGDLALLGCPLLGHVIAYKSGHRQHLGLMREIVAHPEAWEFVELKKDGEHSAVGRTAVIARTAENMLLPFLAAAAAPPPLADNACAA